MADIKIMQGFQTSNNLNEIVPNFFLCEICTGLLMIRNLLHEITAIGILHNQAETVRGILKESFLVADDVWVINRR